MISDDEYALKYGFDSDKAKSLAQDTLEYAHGIDDLRVENLSSDVELLLHQDFAQTTIIYNNVLDHFLRAVQRDMPFGGYAMSEDELEGNLDLAFKEETVSRHRLLLRRIGEPQSLTDITTVTCKKDDPNLSRARRKVRDGIDPMEELWLWRVERVPHAKAGEHYKIAAGPALIAFNRHIFTPLRLEMLQNLKQYF